MDMAHRAPSGARAGHAEYETGGYKWYVAGVLCLAHMVAMVDRFVMVLVSEPVRAALHLTDTQLGLLQGTGFSLLYCGFAIPLGAIADATNRRNLILFGLAVWSVATVMAATATSFGGLFAARILVGMGEACLIPAGMSLLTTYFAPANLARGTAVFGMGANFGLGLAFLGGGIVLAALQARGGLAVPGLGPVQPWQGVFLLAGLLAVPVLVLLCWLKEPPRARSAGGFAAARYAPFLGLAAMTAVTGYTLNSWSSSLFVRVHGMSAAEAGKMIGLVGLLAGPLGTIGGGVVLDRMRARGVAGAPLLVMAGGSVVALLTAAGIGHAPSLPVAILLFCLFMVESTYTLPSIYAGMQLLTPPAFRGVAASFNMMIYTLAGLGIGPAAVGAISDRLQGPRALADAIVLVEAAMALLIVPIALLARQAYQRRVAALAG
jgi:MFS family permease